MAVIRRIQAQQTIDIGGIPSTQVDDSVGRGLQQVGGALQDHAATMHRLEMARIEQNNRIDEFAATQEFQRLGDDMSAEFAEKQVNMDPSGKGFTESVSGIFNQRSEQFLKNVPDHLKPKFSELLATARNQWVDKAAAAEVDQRNNWYRTSIAERAEILQTQVFNDPAMFDAAKEDVFRTIDASGLPLTEKEALKKKTEEMFSLAIGERDIRDAEADPTTAGDAAKRLGVGPAVPLPKDVQGRANLARDHFIRLGYTPEQAAGIVGNLVQESGVRSDGAVGDNGTAFGVAQWRGERFSRLKRFAASRGRDWRDFTTQLDFIDMELKNHETSAYKRLKNAKTIEEATAAFIGYERPRGWTPNNPTAGHGWANRLAAAQKTAGVPVTASGPVEVDPRFAALSLSERLTLYDRIVAAAQRGQQRIDAQRKAAYDAEKGSLELGIQTGEVVSVEQILSSNMTDAHKADLISALRSRQGDQLAISEALAAFQAGNFKADPYSTDDRKKVDGVYEALEKAVPGDQMQAVSEDLIRQTGVVPSKLHNSLRAAAESTVPAEVEAALTQASRIADISPAMLGRRDGGGEVQKKVDLFNTLTRSMGYSPSEAAKRIAEQNDPEKARQRSALLSSEPVKKMLKDVGERDITSAFKSYFSMGWQLGADEAQKAAMIAEYKEILQETIIDANGDQTVAKELANQRFQRLYGASKFTLANAGWTNVITRLPPEKVYEPLPDGSFDYIGEQMREALAAEGVKFDEVYLKEYDDTDRDFRNGEPPRYQVWYRRGDKLELYSLPFYADRNAALAKYEAEQQRLLEERRRQNLLNSQEELRRYPEGRDGPERFSNDELYYGAARRGSPMGQAIEQRQQQIKSEAAKAPKVEDLATSNMQDLPGFQNLDPTLQQRLQDMDADDPIRLRQQIIEQNTRRR